MMGLTQDLRYAVRTLKHGPGYTLIALLTLALGIGANTAIFSMIRGVLLRPLPYREGERLVFLEQPASLAGVQDARFSVPELGDYRSQSRSLEGIVEYHSMPFILLGDGEPSRVQTGVVSANFFDVLGVTPHLGRAFREGEDLDEARRAALAWSQCGLFLMIFVPGVYFDPVKLAMLCLAAICARVCVLRRFYRGVIRTCNVSRKQMSWRCFKRTLALRTMFVSLFRL